MTDSPGHILVVDDDVRLAALLRRFLSEHGYRVTVATGAEDARQKRAGLIFDLLVVDRMMPGESGTDFVRSVRETEGDDPATPIMMLTALGESEDRIAGLEAGVDDYLTKPFEPRELLLRIEAILRRTRPRPQGLVQFGRFSFDLEKGKLFENDEEIYLTSGEIALLRALTRNPGVAVSREKLSTSGEGQGRAVDVQITRLRKKIEDDPRTPRFLQTVRGEGYVLWTD
ncbi:response regulator [Oceanibacterium hippocampi]|uniref:Transcriptional regulatory protein OmpR n=1 Tax=Oceanibacterium hippocampi TaxID=745714 RepID=A0A1Y5TW78_9PROT|nr:response regulator [Oceanibacterium hippocampi]SLN74475.1 Transcriptional regulatory protein OmpR [Oceanibacterium hippocampi]